eukprot:TRINITY_DN3321_c3_g3_i1.p1 TRINITY_DN3321_c3_g3~~TRINITY_DN3321_c3_g3_i1.p1  ORF type:complete len:360 (+),score=73.68 TRINITY_DN3321_c3_g3_i1:111-1082(+)
MDIVLYNAANGGNMLKSFSPNNLFQNFLEFQKSNPQKANKYASNHLKLLIDNQKPKNLLLLTKMFPAYAKSLFDTQEGEPFVNKLVGYSKNVKRVVSTVMSSSNQQEACSLILLLLKHGLWLCYDEYVLIQYLLDDEICDINFKNGGNLKFPHFSLFYIFNRFSFSNLMNLTPNKHPQELSNLFDFMVEHKKLLDQTDVTEICVFLEAYPIFTKLLFEKIVPKLSNTARLAFLELLPKIIILEFPAIVRPFSQKIEMICDLNEKNRQQNMRIDSLVEEIKLQKIQLERVTSCCITSSKPVNKSKLSKPANCGTKPTTIPRQYC